MTQLCACGCGQQVKTPGRRFTPGHNSRTTAWKERHALTARKGQTQICSYIYCEREYYVPSSAAQTQRYCDRRCAYAARRTTPNNREFNTLQIRCLRHMAKKRWACAELAREAGLHDSALRRWLKHRDNTLTAVYLSRLAEFFGISLEQAIQEAGGQTAEEKISKTSRTTGQRVFPAGWTVPKKTVRASALTRTGRRHSSETIAKIKEAKTRTGSLYRNVPALVGW